MSKSNTENSTGSTAGKSSETSSTASSITSLFVKLIVLGVLVAGGYFVYIYYIKPRLDTKTPSIPPPAVPSSRPPQNCADFDEVKKTCKPYEFPSCNLQEQKTTCKSYCADSEDIKCAVDEQKICNYSSTTPHYVCESVCPGSISCGVGQAPYCDSSAKQWTCKDLPASYYIQKYGLQTVMVTDTKTGQKVPVVCRDSSCTQPIPPTTGPLVLETGQRCEWFVLNDLASSTGEEAMKAINNPTGNLVLDKDTGALSLVHGDEKAITNNGLDGDKVWYQMAAKSPEVPYDKYCYVFNHCMADNTDSVSVVNDSLKCTCKSGAVGPLCNYTDDNYCCSHGKVRVDNVKCVETPGVKMDDPHFCFTDGGNPGTYNVEPKCTCNQVVAPDGRAVGWDGPRCNIQADRCGQGYVNSVDSTCSKCDNSCSFQCSCLHGAKGTQCEYTRELTCSTHGDPQDNGSCSCDAGWSGAKCSVPFISAIQCNANMIWKLHAQTANYTGYGDSWFAAEVGSQPKVLMASLQNADPGVPEDNKQWRFVPVSGTSAPFNGGTFLLQNVGTKQYYYVDPKDDNSQVLYFPQVTEPKERFYFIPQFVDSSHVRIISQYAQTNKLGFGGPLIIGYLGFGGTGTQSGGKSNHAVKYANDGTLSPEHIDHYTIDFVKEELTDMYFADSGNNGQASCDAYCARNWNNVLPSDWNGATCVGAYSYAQQKGVPCNLVTDAKGQDDVRCICKRNDALGWKS